MPAGLLSRVAVRTDAALGTREDILFLPAHGDEVFCVLHRPAAPPRGAVVICCSLFSEQLKLYRTEVLAARALASGGFAVARFHYRGTGHGGGIMDNTTLGTMLEDAAIVAGFLRQSAPTAPLAFCGARWGGLVASLAAARDPGAPLMLWEPALGGRQFFQDILRAKLFSAVASGSTASARKNAVLQELQTRGWVDAMGHPIYRGLFESATDRFLMQLPEAGPRPVLLVQVSRQRQLKREFAEFVSACRARGCPVETATIEAEEAWSFVGPPLQSTAALIAVTTPWLRKTVAHGGRS